MQTLFNSAVRMSKANGICIKKKKVIKAHIIKDQHANLLLQWTQAYKSRHKEDFSYIKEENM